jgi:hypothetical protein
MKLTAASSDGRQTSLSFDREEGPIDIRCLYQPGEIPSCKLWVGDSSVALDSEQEIAIEKILAQFPRV